MISRIHRFHGYSSLRFVYQHGSVVRGPHSALKYARNSRRTTYRAAVVVGRKVQKSAVARNRLRRRIYEAVRGEEANIDGPYDLVFTVFNEQLNELSPAELQKLINIQLHKAGVLTTKTKSTPNHGIVDERKTA